MNNNTKKTKKHWKGLLIRLGIIAGIIIIFFCLFGIHIYHGNNMITSLRDGELVITGKYTKPLADRVVVYKHNNETYFGRVVGMSGDKIDITSDRFTINNNIPVEEIFFDTKPYNQDIHLEVPEGSVFIMNDYREDLMDSRSFGCISESDIEGCIVFSISRRGF